MVPYFNIFEGFGGNFGATQIFFLNVIILKKSRNTEKEQVFFKAFAFHPYIIQIGIDGSKLSSESKRNKGH